MLCYFISKKDFKITQCTGINAYTITQNLDLGGKSKVIIADSPNASKEDFVILRDGRETIFKGIVESIDNYQGEKMHTVQCMEIERIFDQKIFLSDTEIINASGIEDFVSHTIKKYFSHTGDAFIDMPYMTCAALTHTKVSSKPDADDGVYNFKTYLGNIKEQYGIFLDFEFTKTKLNISIHKKEQTAMQIDTTITDIDNCKETYEVKALTKLNVLWKNLLTSAEEVRIFYLHSNRTISEKNADRVEGTTSALYVEFDTEEEMLQAVYDEFKSNSYSHLIEADIYANSKIYPKNELYVGHEVKIKTSAGVKESIISGISYADTSNAISVKFGNLKVSLTDKLK